MQRLDRFLSEAGVASRRELRTIIRAGRVRVTDVPASAPEQKIDETSDRVTLDGEAVGPRGPVVLLLHKPTGYVTSTDDPRDRTVMELLPPQYRGLAPVGRLDKDTEGLLLRTNEGGLAHDILSPKHHVDKVYYARTAGCLTEEDCRAFAAGMTLGGGLECLPAGLEILSAGPEGSEGLVTLREGKFHQVKRMLAARGKPVLYLKRVRMGNLPLDPALEPGTYRYLTEDEVESLRNF